MIKTVIVEGYAWPKVFPKGTEFTDHIVKDGEFMHPVQKKQRKKKDYPELNLDQIFGMREAEKQLESFETRRSVRKQVHLNLKGKNVVRKS